jgi:plasmid maintenance system antidote protein VapI
MTLDEFLTAEPITAAEFAERVGLTEASISRIRRGGQNITRDVMLRIIDKSNGKVTPDGLVRLAV